MKRLCLPLLHPLAEVFFAAVQSVTTSMSDSTKGRYRTTTDTFFAIWVSITQASGLSTNFDGTRIFWAG